MSLDQTALLDDPQFTPPVEQICNDPTHHCDVTQGRELGRIVCYSIVSDARRSAAASGCIAELDAH